MSGGTILPRGLRAIWTKLSSGLEDVYTNHNPVPASRYMELYTLVFNYCAQGGGDDKEEDVPMQAKPTPGARQTRSQAKRDSDPVHPSSSTNFGTEFIGSDLYNLLRDFIYFHARRVLKDFDDLKEDQLLDKYINLWEKYQFSSTVVNGIFAYLNRHWIRRQQDDKKNNVLEVYNLAILAWKSEIFEIIHEKITAGVLKLILQERTGQIIPTKLIAGVVKSCTELGINDVKNDVVTTVSLPPSSKLAVYKKHIENPFIKATSDFYTQESTEFIEKNSITEYMKKVMKRITEENERCQLYLDQSTLEPLTKACDEVLITKHLDLFRSQFETLLANHQDEDLSRMYTLCQRVEGALIPLLEALEEFIKREGNNAIQNIAADANNDPNKYVKTILDVHSRFNSVVCGPFNRDPRFLEAMDKALEKFINENQVTIDAKNASKSPELLARYCDILLKKGSKNMDEKEVEDLLTQVITVFKYINDKDVFEKFYQKLLGKRLIHGLSSSDEAESNIISKLQTMCGYDYTQRLTKMFTDKNLSKDISESFKQSRSEGSADFDFSIMTLTSGTWVFDLSHTFNIPPTLSNVMEEFTRYYQGLHSGRQLKLARHLSQGEVVCNGLPRKYTFTVTTEQMAILLLYNDLDERTLRMLATEVGLGLEKIVGALRNIVKIKLLTIKSEEARDLDTCSPDTVIQFNPKFNSIKLKIQLNRAVARQEIRAENDDVQNEVDADRRMVIQAAIVRIMKMRKSLKHTQLMNEVIQQLTKFHPKVHLIKKCIDELIEKLYIKRVDNDRDTYEYLA